LAATTMGAAMTVELEGALPDLSLCSSEPIHIPGAIQPHGVLVSMDLASLAARQVSDNAEGVLGIPVERLLNVSAEQWLGDGQVARLRIALTAPSPEEAGPLSITLGGSLFDGLVHRVDGLCVLELEPRVIAQADLHEGELQTVLGRLSSSAAMPQLLNTLVLAVRELTGFDRVVVYRFDEDDHGEVVAEARDEEMEPYLGLHYPESDIPRQARDLYRRNWIRNIPNAIYVPAKLIPAWRPDKGAPLDLSHSILRSVSPVHLEYMANMGLQASMSVSLIADGRLWGLLSCGHRRPRFMTYRLRKACETIGRIASLQISALQAIELRRAQETKAELVRQLADSMHSSEDDVLDGVRVPATQLLSLTESSGAAVFSSGGVASVGQTPDEKEGLLLARWVQGRCDAGGIFHTDRLGEMDARWSGLSGIASGVLGFMLPTPEPRGILWFRPEQVQTVKWGGDPNKSVQLIAGRGAARVHPRRSFELWKEVVRNRSSRWEAGAIHAAIQLRRCAIEVDLGRQVAREKAAVQARDDLVAVVSHDLRNPMSVVVMQAALMQRLLAEDGSESNQRLLASANTIQRAGQRMTSMLGDLLELAKIEAGRYEVTRGRVVAEDMLQEVCELLRSLGQAKDVSLVYERAPGIIVSADAERIFQVFSNLIGNAVKYAPEHSTVRVGAKRLGEMCEFWVTDEGPGVNPEQLPHLFERYWQAHPSARGGAGLGLYIAKGIVEAHGGTIRAEQESGLGATFRFTLPVA
jgi:chemotaxis family two-component system sensor kinase Cph1